jgi:hypothetical protein
MTDEPMTEAGRPALQVLFADGLTGVLPGPALCRLQFSALIPSSEPIRAAQVAQIVMPTASFVQAVAFLDQVVSDLIKANVITDEDWEAARASVGKGI